GAAAFRYPLLMPAMMAHQHAAEAMLDQPGRTVRALVLVPASPAERQRRIAAPVEEEQRLLAPVERRKHLAGEPRRNPLPLLGWLLAHVERRDVGQLRPGETAFQPDMTVALAVGVVPRLDRGRRRGEDCPRAGEPGPHHRHVAGVIID